MNKHKGSQVFFIIVVLSSVIGLATLYIVLFKPFPSQQAKEVVDEFYSYEQEGNFSGSWTLFHTQMKERLPDDTYVQERGNILRNDFGVTTFDYTLGFPNKEKNWRMTEDLPPFKIVYKIPVTQMYNGKYGNFEIHQDVYAALEGEEWKVLWDYKNEETN